MFLSLYYVLKVLTHEVLSKVVEEHVGNLQQVLICSKTHGLGVVVIIVVESWRAKHNL